MLDNSTMKPVSLPEKVATAFSSVTSKLVGTEYMTVFIAVVR
ncbi:MAG: hypothetical protein Q4F95_08655 [Oscillospiraceae bacterium]|nr:hypothetical protein [Oscillospiraceae bacterium]